MRPATAGIVLPSNWRSAIDHPRTFLTDTVIAVAPTRREFSAAQLHTRLDGFICRQSVSLALRQFRTLGQAQQVAPATYRLTAAGLFRREIARLKLAKLAEDNS